MHDGIQITHQHRDLVQADPALRRRFRCVVHSHYGHRRLFVVRLCQPSAGEDLRRVGNRKTIRVPGKDRRGAFPARPVEAREHVRRFHELFFTVAPDKDAIEKNMERAFLLCDKTAYDYYRDLAEKGYFNRIISGNINQRVEVDSIRCDFDHYPYEVTTYARQFIVRPSNVTERNLITTCTLQNAVRSDNNPQGFLMEHFLVRENRDIQTYKR